MVRASASKSLKWWIVRQAFFERARRRSLSESRFSERATTQPSRKMLEDIRQLKLFGALVSSQ